MQRPTAVTVFGILNIAFGAMALVCTPLSFLMSFASQAMLENMPDVPQAENPFQEMMEAPGFMTYTYVTTALGMAVGGLLLVAGIGLLRLRPWARHVSIGYGVYAWVSAIAGGIISYFVIYAPMAEKLAEVSGPQSASLIGGMFGGVAGMCIGLIYPTILLIFMLRPEIKAAFQPGWGTPPPVPPETRV